MRRIVRYAVGMAAVAVFIRIDLLFGIALLLGLLAVYARVLPPATLKKVQVSRTHPSRLFWGEKAEVVVTAANQGWIPIVWLAIREFVPFDISPGSHRTRWVTSLTARESRGLRYDVTGRRRGYYRLGPAAIETGGVFGIRSFSGGDVEASRLIVYPKIVPIGSKTLPSRSPMAHIPTTRPLFEDAVRVGGLRDYQSGDSVRRIHWTASASRGALTVKQLEYGTARETVIVLDMDSRSYPGRRRLGPELSVIAAASFASRIAVEEELPVGLESVAHDPVAGRVVDISLPARKGRGHLIEVLEVLARVQADDVPPLPAVLNRLTGSVGWGTTVLIITGRMDDEAAAATARLRRFGLSPAAVHIMPDRRQESRVGQVSALGIPVVEVNREQDLSA